MWEDMNTHKHTRVQHSVYRGRTYVFPYAMKTVVQKANHSKSTQGKEGKSGVGGGEGVGRGEGGEER